jgi:sigma-B regulation protein RsbU (phosphoserine phosphatase)
VSLKYISRIIALATLLIVGLFIVLLVDDEQQIQSISRDITQAAPIVSTSMTRTRALLRFTFVFETVLLAALVGFILLGLSQRVIRPLNALRSDLRAAAHDHLHVIASAGPEEIAQVATDAEQLRRSLVNQTDLTEQSTNALHHQAPAAAAIRASLERGIHPVSGFAGYSRPTEGVIAGDWWWAGVRSDGNRIFAIADVSGHGVNAGVMAIESRSIVSTALASFVPLDEIAQALVRHTWDEGKFLTLFMGVIGNERLEFCSAGHEYSCILNSTGQFLLPPTGPVVSNLGGRWTTSSVPFNATSVFLAATDGLIEPTSTTQVDQWFAQAASAHPSAPENSLMHLLSASRKATEGWPDDLTVILATGI